MYLKTVSMEISLAQGSRYSLSLWKSYHVISRLYLFLSIPKKQVWLSLWTFFVMFWKLLNFLTKMLATILGVTPVFYSDDLRWEFIKENKKVRKQEKKKKELDQESDKEKKNSTKKKKLDSTKKAIPIILSCFLDRFLIFFLI